MANEVTIKTESGKSYTFEPKNWAKKSREELIDIIKIITEESNERIGRYKERESLASVENQITALKSLGSELKETKELGVGKYQSKKKEILVNQARQLYQFHNWDFVENEGREKILESESKRLAKLRENYSDLTEDLDEVTLRRMTEALGAAGKELTEKFDSATLIAMESIAKNIEKIDLVELMLKVLRENKGEDQDVLVDKLDKEILKEVEKLNKKESE